MLALWFENGRAGMRDAPLPRAKKDWAVVEVLRSGICNTDLELLRGYHGFRGIPGHEFIGRTSDGRRVVGEINAACGRPTCAWCAGGLGRHCPRRTVLGIVRHHGAHAQYLTLPQSNLLPVPDNVTDEQAVFVEPLAAAAEILEQVGTVSGRRAAVLGDGKLGLLIGQVLAAGGADVVVLGKHADKLALARRLGLDASAAGRARRAAFDLVVEATGSPTGMPRALELVRPRGTVVWKSTFHGMAKFDAAPLVVNEVTVVGSRCGRFAPALDLLAGGDVKVDPLISDVLPLSRATQALRLAARPGVMKVLLQT